MSGLAACDDCHTSLGACIDGDLKCERNSVTLCVGGQWEMRQSCQSTETCNATTYTCDADTCSAGSKRCKDNAVQRCTAGLWAIETQCAGKDVCSSVSLSCETPTPLCVQGAKRCKTNAIEVCADNAWTIEAQCAGKSLCNPQSLSCEAIICEAGAKRCENNNVELCADNAWQMYTTCSDITACNSETYTCHLTCEEGATMCTDSGTVETCHDSRWILGNCDAGQVCPSMAFGCEDKVCNANEVFCNPEKNASIICIKNKLRETKCWGTMPLCEAGDCVVCINGQQRCENNEIKLCAGNVWTSKGYCGPKVCNPTTFVCDDVTCDVDWKRCNQNTLETCNAQHKYEAAGANQCGDSKYCIEDAAEHFAFCGECTDDAQCASSDSGKACNHGHCTPCRAGINQKCHDDNGTLIVCDKDGFWPKNGVACTPGRECLAGSSECTDMPGYCLGNGDCIDPLYPTCDKNRCI